MKDEKSTPRSNSTAIFPSSKTSGYKKFSSIVVKIWRSQITKYFLSLLIISLSGTILYFVKAHIGYQAVSLVFLFIVSLLPLLNFRPGPIFLAAVMSAFIWNFFFIPPSFTFRIGKIEDVLMFAMYFVIASVSGLLISRIRMQQLMLTPKGKENCRII